MRMIVKHVLPGNSLAQASALKSPFKEKLGAGGLYIRAFFQKLLHLGVLGIKIKAAKMNAAIVVIG